MRFRTTLIIASLLAVLGAYTYFIEYKGAEKKKEKEEQQKTLIEIKKEDVVEIRIEGLSQPVKVVPLSSDAWQLTSPLQTRADEATVGRILSGFEKLKFQQIVEAQPKTLTQYELEKPKLTLHFAFKRSKPEQVVMIGGKNPVGDLYYLRVNKDPRVYAVEGLAEIVSTTLFDLRDKKLTDFSSEKVESLALHESKADLLFQKEAGTWKMKKPVESPASDSEVSSLLSSLEVLRATQFIDNPSADLTEYGLEDPSATIELRLEKGLQEKILFGKKQNEQIYCRIEGSPSIATVTDSFSDYFNKELKDWREKKLIVFNRFDAEEVRARSAGNQYFFKKGKEEKWTEESPARGEIEADKLQDFLEKLETAEIDNYGDKPALAGAPVLEVSMRLKDWQDKITKKHLAFAAAEGNQQPVKNDDYNTIVFVNGALQKDLETALAAIKPRAAAPAQTKK